jgi:hypothetical protein
VVVVVVVTKRLGRRVGDVSIYMRPRSICQFELGIAIVSAGNLSSI